MKIRIEQGELENVLGDLTGLLSTLKQEEFAGLGFTSLPLEISAVESIKRKLCQLVKKSIH